MTKPKVSLMGGVAIAVSMVVGSGIFGLPGLAIRATDPLTALLGWAMVILMMPSLIYVFAWLGMRFPSAEGISLHASLGLGSWSRPGIMMITCGTLAVGMPAFFLVGGSYIASLLSLRSESWSVPCAAMLAVLTTLINVRGIDRLALMNKVVVVAVICVAMYISVRMLPYIPAALGAVGGEEIRSVPISRLWMAMSIVFWAFQGWENMSFGLAEVERPRVRIPLIYWFSYAVVALIYVVFALAMFAAGQNGLDVSGIGGVVGLLPGGVWGRIALAVMVAILVANASSWVFGSSRAFCAAAALGLLPRNLGKLNGNGIPARMLVATLAMYLVAIAGMAIFKVDERYAFLLTTQGFIILYGGAVLAFFRGTGRWWQWGIGLLAILCWIFLVGGFGWLLLYPLTLMLLGSYVGRKQLMRDTGRAFL